MNKICNKCNIEKTINLFWKNKGNIDGHEGQCIECRKKYFKDNEENFKIRRKKWSEKNKERCKKVRHERHLKNKEHDRIRNNQWRKDNIDKVREYHRNYAKNKRKTNPSFLIAHNLRARINTAIKRKESFKQSNLFELLGCNIEELIKYIESLFTKGMSWDTYGRWGWHIDHVIPCDRFDLTKLEQQQKCFHYTNLRPLWATREVAIKYGENENYVGNLNRTQKDYCGTLSLNTSNSAIEK